MLVGLFRLLAVSAVAAATLLLVEKVWIRPPLGPFSVAVTAGLLLLSASAWLSARGLRRSDRRLGIAKAWLAFSSVAISYLVVDVGAGLTLPRPHIVADRKLHHRLAAGLQARLTDWGLDYTLRTNQLGLRGPEFPTHKPPGVYRILLLGDSFAMGKGVEESETFGSLIEADLNRDRPLERTFQVINAGVDSYAPVLSNLQLEELLSLEPDLVVYALDMGDLLQEQAYRALAVRDDAGRIIAVDGTQPSSGVPIVADRIARWARSHLYLTRILMVSLHDRSKIDVDNTVRGATADLLRHTLEGDEEDRTAQWSDVFESIGNMKAACQKSGVGFLLTIYPWGHQVSAREWAAGRRMFMEDGSRPSETSRNRIHQLSDQGGVEIADTFDDFRAYHGDALLYFRDDMHWTAAGHRVMANSLGAAIRSRLSR